MKNTIYLTFMWILGAALVSSCSSSSDLTSSSLIQKRKYTKGYHVDFGAKKRDKSTTVAALEEAAPSRDATPIAVSEAAPNEPVLTASADNAIEEVSTSKFENLRIDEPESTEMPADMAADMAASDATATQFTSDIDKREMRKSIRSHRKAARNASAASAAASASGESLLLYVIIAIFIPPLAVGLLYGISTEFWISLLLTLIFFIPGMIYSIIKVLAH